MLLDARRLDRRAVLTVAGFLATKLWGTNGLALEPEVPIRLQIDLLNRVIPFDRAFPSKVNGELSILIVQDPNDTDSAQVSQRVLSELKERDTLGGYRQRPTLWRFSAIGALVDECKRLKAGVLYVSPGLGASIEQLATALKGLNLLSVGALPNQVERGLALGFAARSGKPRILVNLKQARLQGVDFRADFLRMAEVVG